MQKYSKKLMEKLTLDYLTNLKNNGRAITLNSLQRKIILNFTNESNKRQYNTYTKKFDEIFNTLNNNNTIKIMSNNIITLN